MVFSKVTKIQKEISVVLNLSTKVVNVFNCGYF